MSVHSEGAQALVEQIRALREKVPNLVTSVSKAERKRMASAAGVPAEFVERMAAGVENHAPLVRPGALPPEQLRDLMSYAESYGPVADEVEALASVIRHSVTAARHKVGSEVLITYALAQRLAERPEHADLIPHVAAMRRTLGGRGRGKAKAEAPQSETPKPESPATSPAPSTTPSSKP